MIQQIFDIYKNELLPIIKNNKAIKDINEGKLYYAPFVYENEEVPSEEDNIVHYTDESANKTFSERIGTEIKIHHETDKIMRYIKIKNQQSQKEYLAMFSTIESLRKIYPANMARICLVGREYIENFAWETEGIVIDLDATIPNNTLKEKGFKLKNKTIVSCFVCNEDFVFDDSNIPQGERYEAICPKCGAFIKREKV